MLSPEYDMKSRVEIRFSEAIFSDTGSLYSPEYRAFRTEQKKKILKHLHITPDIEIGIDDIALSPNKLEVFGNFREGVRYKIELDDIEDIFGRRASFTYDFLPEKKPFLSLVLDKRKKIFSLGEDITAKIYSLSSSKDTYTVKMCELSLEDYARVERIEEDKKRVHLDEFYEFFASDRTKNCVKKDITLTSDQAVTSFRLQDMVEGGVISPGLYVVAFRNQDDIRPFDRFVSPRVFSVLDTHITMKLDVSGDMQVLVTDMLDRRPRPNAEVRYSRNIGKTADLSWDPEKREYQQKDTPLSDQIFATGILLGTTDDSGMLSLSREAVQEIFGDSQIFSMYNDTYEYG